MIASTSVLLPIENVQQRNAGTCWASCVAQALKFLTGRTVGETELCTIAGVRPEHGATEHDMAKLFGRFGTFQCRTMAATPPDRVTLILARRHPIILSLCVGRRFRAHAVVLRGIFKDPNGYHAVVNDPNLADYFSMFVQFSRLQAAWHTGLVVAPKAQVL